jgi:transglutaminase-like putative cysteine protease
MTWRLEINHVTRYRYDRPVVASYNEARVTPLSIPRQLVIDAEVAVQPAAELYCYRDYWGAFVHCFDLHDPHDSLVVRARATVDTGPPEPGLPEPGLPEPGLPERGTSVISWEHLASPELRDRFYEFLAPSRLVSVEDLSGVADRLLSSDPTPAAGLQAALEWANGVLEYVAGATHVHTSAVEAWRAGRGVCQDFAHLSLAVLRAMGIPARYVSGYFYPKAAGDIGAKVLGESHAWIEAWTGAWTGYDPTNLLPVAERYVVVARGRDYADVAPLRGIYSGPPGSSSEVTVELTRRA